MQDEVVEAHTISDDRREFKRNSEAEFGRCPNLIPGILGWGTDLPRGPVAWRQCTFDGLANALLEHLSNSAWAESDNLVFCRFDGDSSDPNYLRKKVPYPAGCASRARGQESRLPSVPALGGKYHLLDELMSVHKNPYGTWVSDLSARLSPTNKRTRVVILSARTKKQAEDAERTIIQKIHEGKYGTPKGSTLLSHYVKKHFTPWTKLNKRSWRNDLYRLKPILAFFGKKQLREISPFLIERFKLERLRAPVVSKHKQKDRAPGSVNRELQLLSAIFRQATIDKKAAENPCLDVQMLQGEKHRERYLLPEEEARLMPILVSDRAHLAAMVELTINTGLREMELLKLTRAQVNFDRGAILASETKSGTDRWVPMNDVAERILKELCDNARRRNLKYLFTNPKTKTHYTTVKTAWKTACKLAEIV